MFCGAPVPAGISLPMITFSLRPIRWSRAPLMAASVSTRVVSWKEAAARKDDVFRDALVTPRSTVCAVAGSPPSDEDAVVRLLEVQAVDELGRQLLAVARLVDPDLLEHLADDDLDVLVVDRDALAPVDPLDLPDQVALDGVLAPGVEVLLRVDRTVRDGVAGADLRPSSTSSLALCGIAYSRSTTSSARTTTPSSVRARKPFTGAVTSPTDAERASTWLSSTRSPGAASSSAPSGSSIGVSKASRLVTLTLRPVSPPMTSTMPSMWLISALPLGIRASNSSSTRGRPCVMSWPATPPVWNVRMVSCVPGSPMDWAAMMPTASPMPIMSPVARLRP